MSEQDSSECEIRLGGRLRRLIEANQYLAEVESLDDLFPRLLDLGRDVLGAEAASVMLYNPKREVLEFAAVKDEQAGEKAAEILKSTVTLKMGEGIAGWVAQNRKPVIVRDAQNDPRFFGQADKQTGFITRTLLCVPLIHQGELLGVISVLNSKNKPSFDTEDQELLESFANLSAVAIIRSRLFETRIREERLEAKLEAAAKIQALFWPKLPDQIGAGSRVWAVSIPAAFVGGDLYDLIPMPDGSWLVYVADVSDKGLPAALLMASLSTKIRSEALLDREMGQFLRNLNDAMFDLMADEGFFATIVLGKYWPGTGRLELALGGHLPPLWVTPRGLRSLPQLKGRALGVIAGLHYDKQEIMLSPGESIFFITDGVTDAENKRGERFGQRRVVDYLQNTPGPPWGKGLLDALEKWRDGAEASDDITVMELWRVPRKGPRDWRGRG
jgi:sigma-B regulation protein RsbU (phosphoserine phosphatase)